MFKQSKRFGFTLLQSYFTAMKKLLLLFAALCAFVPAFAQNSARISIKGSIVDTLNAPLVSATVMLLTPKDSALMSYGRSDEKGGFEFKNIKRGNYLLKITYVGYLPYQKELKPADAPETNAGQIKLKGISKELFEVVIKTARAPLIIKGDTVEYNASSFKVPPGSTVEDLLRRLPGFQVNQDGSIRAQGQEVKKVTVDGKNFFGGDPKTATKNLAAESISKVQVFNGQSEQSKLTGVDDGKKEKTVNLQLKEEFKKGGFGKMTAGAGSAGRTQARGNYNRFNPNEQFSIIGFGNNINQTGISREDYEDFKGSQSNNWGDDGDFGFGGGFFRFYSDDDDDGQDFSVPTSYGPGRGFSRNAGAGLNYNYDTKKTKFSSNYFYNQTNQTLDALTNKKNFLQNNETFRSSDSSGRANFLGNHRGSLRFEKTIDSLNTLVVFANVRSNSGNNTFQNYQQFLRTGDVLSNRSEVRNRSTSNSFAAVATAIYRHKFKKKGRNFSASFTYGLTNRNASGNQFSDNQFFFKTSTGRDSTTRTLINQDNTTVSQQNEIKASLSYIEPLSKKFFWESFYNFSLRQDEVNRDVMDKKERPLPDVRNNTLSRYYTNDFTYNRLGSSLRYSFKTLNVSAGLAAMSFQLRGKFAPDQTASTFTDVNRNFSVVVPNVSLSIDLKNNKYLYGSYDVTVQPPSVRNLQPVIDNSNPLFITEGNPDLLPTLSHSPSIGFNSFNPASFTNIFGNLYYNYQINQVVFNQTVDERFITRTKPANISGGQMVGGYFNFGFPLKKTKATMNLNSSLNLGRNLTFINNVLNTTNSNSYQFGMRLDLTPSEKFTFFGNANLGITDTRYSINTTQNQQIYNHSFGGEMNVALPKNIYFNSTFNYNVFINRRFGFDQRLPILNLSVYKMFLKDNKAEIRLSAYDVFNRNVGISQSATQNYVSDERVQTLARYFMLTFTYNVRGMKAKMRKGGFW